MDVPKPIDLTKEPTEILRVIAYPRDAQERDISLESRMGFRIACKDELARRGYVPHAEA